MYISEPVSLDISIIPWQLENNLDKLPLLHQPLIPPLWLQIYPHKDRDSNKSWDWSVTKWNLSLKTLTLLPRRIQSLLFQLHHGTLTYWQHHQKINLEINNSITFKFHWYDLLDRSIYLRFTFNLPSIYIQEHHFWTFTWRKSTFILPSIYLQLTIILQWLTFTFWSKYFYIQLTFNLHTTYL